MTSFFSTSCLWRIVKKNETENDTRKQRQTNAHGLCGARNHENTIIPGFEDEQISGIKQKPKERIYATSGTKIREIKRAVKATHGTDIVRTSTCVYALGELQKKQKQVLHKSLKRVCFMFGFNTFSWFDFIRQTKSPKLARDCRHTWK